MLFRSKFDDANAQIEHAKSHAVDGPYNLGRAMELQAEVWYQESRLEEAKCEVLGAVDIFEKLGATEDVEVCRGILRDIEAAITKQAASHA